MLMQCNSKFAFFDLQPESQVVYTVWSLQKSKSWSQEIILLSVLLHIVKETFFFF